MLLNKKLKENLSAK